MKSPLLHHQAIGLAWMNRQEHSDNASKGGMLCDSMGLGKTVETIALKQWKAEIEKHASKDVFGGVTIYRAAKGEDIKVITAWEVVLTSYAEIENSCPFPSRSEMLILKKEYDFSGTAGAHNDDSNVVERWIEESMEFCEILHQVDWYRIVVDEAHRMKNHHLRFSHAVNALKGKHRWVLTGTPIMNRLEELYGYFRFLKEPDAKSFKMFKAKFTNIAKARLHFVHTTQNMSKRVLSEFLYRSQRI
ncbi:hypothetical protein WAI453_008309 [Rhynchosporium graminicola]